MKLWDISTGREIRSFEWQTDRVNAIAFSSDGKSVLSGGHDGVNRQWSTSTGKERAQFISFSDGEWISITPEGYYNASLKGAKKLNVRMGNNVYGIDQFYDVFYRPDIVQAKLQGEEISSLITLTIDDAIKNPPPTVKLPSMPNETSKPSINVCYNVKSSGGGIGEVRLFHNGKLVKSDGFYREATAKKGDEKLILAAVDGKSIYNGLRRIAAKGAVAVTTFVAKKKNEYQECQELETMPGENEVSVSAFNSQNSVQSNLETVRFTVDRKQEEPHLYVLGIGIDHYKDTTATLKYAAKDARDFRALIQDKAESIYKPQNIHVVGLSDATATKDGVQKAIQKMAAKIKPWDSFILFVAAHGLLRENQYYIVTSGYNGTASEANLISTNEIVEMSKKIKSLSQLFIFDTCHAGGVDAIVSGLYDARMSVMAKKMGLHIYASAGSVQEALDGYSGNGLFTHTLLTGMKDGKTTDSNHDNQVSVVELGQQARQQTIDISRKLGHLQTPYMIDFGNDGKLFRVQ